MQYDYVITPGNKLKRTIRDNTGQYGDASHILSIPLSFSSACQLSSVKDHDQATSQDFL